MKTIMAVMAYKTISGKPLSRTCLEPFHNYDDVLETIAYWIEDFDPENIAAKDRLFQITLDLIRSCEKPSYKIVLCNENCDIRVRIQEL